MRALGVLLSASAMAVLTFIVWAPIPLLDVLPIVVLVWIAAACGLGALVPPEASHIADAIERARRNRESGGRV